MNKESRPCCYHLNFCPSVSAQEENSFSALCLPPLRVGAKKNLYGLQNLQDNNHLCCLTVNSHHTLTKQSLRSGKDRHVHFKCKMQPEKQEKKNSLRNSSIDTLIKETMTNSDDEHGREKHSKRWICSNQILPSHTSQPQRQFWVGFWCLW